MKRRFVSLSLFRFAFRFLFVFVLLVGLGPLGGCSRANRTTAGSPTHAERRLQSPLVSAYEGPRPSFVGAGSLEARGETTPKTNLSLARLGVEANTTGDVVEMEIDHEFRNDADEQLEGTFRFPLPDGAMLTGLAMEIDGTMMQGELVERDKARKAYEQIVDQMLDPALLEWESGHTFKLRVFPIEAKKTKRVLLRLVAPLHRAPDGLYFAYRAPSDDSGMSLSNVSLRVDGKDVTMRSGEALVKVADEAPSVMTEQTEKGTYVLAHVKVPFERAASKPKARGQALILLCDRSRSMLEARALQAQTAASLIDALLASGAENRFSVVTGDVRTHVLDGALHAPTPEARDAAVAFIDRVEPDGASDLGRLLAVAGEKAREARAAGLDPLVVYLGDGTPTWGETRASALEEIANEALRGTPLHAVVLGRSTDVATARALTAKTHGRLFQPKTESDARRAAVGIARAQATRRVDDVELVVPDGVAVADVLPTTWFEGDDVVVSAFVPKGKDLGTTRLEVRGNAAGKPFVSAIPLETATPARAVAKRWAKARIEALERDGDEEKQAIVQTSLDHGVMSRFTSFLVLESEEAYARMQIARNAKAAETGEARVTGRDLEGTSGTATISPDHLQPGDPEVRIPAPRDAQSVVVVFPFGETKLAVWEDDDRGGAFYVRFLVDVNTPDGTYTVTVRITHRDGRIEVIELPYVVDTKEPELDVTITKGPGGAYRIRATQRLDPTEADKPMIYTDAKRVEVRTPEGGVFALEGVKLGEFAGTYRPTAPLPPGATLRLVAIDYARNQRVLEVALP
jgi:hypothetical protein